MDYKYQVSPYKISFKDSLKGKDYFKEGFLLKCKNANNLAGYSDYSSINIEVLKKSILAFKNSKAVIEDTSHWGKNYFNFIQAKQSIKFSLQDLKFGEKKEKLFFDNFFVNNHYLISDISKFPFSSLDNLWFQGYRSLKIKIEEDLNLLEAFFLNLIKNTKNNFLLRLDFNSSISLKCLYSFLDNLTNILKNSSLKVEFLEDPLPYNYENWLQLYDKYQYPLAIDLEWNNFCLQESLSIDSNKNNGASVNKALVFSVIVLKPAIQDVDLILKKYYNQNVKFVLTHYMDHGVGRFFSLLSLNTLISTYGSQIFLDAGLNTFPVSGGGVNWNDYFTNDSSLLKLKKSIYCLSEIFNPTLLEWRDL